MKRLQPPSLGWVLVLVPLAATILLATPDLQGGARSSPDRGRFDNWLASLEHHGDEAAGLYPYYRSKEPDFNGSPDDFLSPMVSAKCVLYWLEAGSVRRAERTARALRFWQHRDAGRRHTRARGALPSQIVRSGGRWTGGDRFYSGDNLIVLTAFLAVYERTRDPDLLAGAREIADWVSGVMCQGVRWGVWKDDLGAPMQFVTRDGALNNQIHTSTEFLWLDALRRSAELLSEPKHLRAYEKARAFLLSAQAPWGAWYEHYDPGYPPVAYDPSRWRWYGGDRPVVVADNELRAALGAVRAGDLEKARRFAAWLRPRRGAVPAYLNARTANGHFDPPTDPYYDVVVSGLWASLCAVLGDTVRAREAEAFLARVQNAGGGWYWGLEAKTLRPLQRSEAVLTGYWAVTGLRPKERERK